MKNETKKRILFIVIAVVVAAFLSFIPAENELLSRAGWQFLGLFIGMLIVIIAGAIEDWAAGLIACVGLVLFKIDTFPNVFVQFSGSQVWTLIAIYALCTGLANSGFLRRVALILLNLFPKSYKGQATGFTIISAIISPLIPSTTAKVGIMSPLACEIGEHAGLKKHSKAIIGLWGISLVTGFYLSCAFLTGSAQCSIMAGLAGEGAAPVTWGSWFALTWPYFIIGLLVMYLFCILYCAPKKGEYQDIPNDFYQKKINELGPMSLKEKQGAIILGISLIFWLTESYHGLSSLCIMIIADIAMLCCGLLTKQEFSSKGNWAMVCFVASLMGFSTYMSSTGVSAAISKILGPFLSPVVSNPWLLIPTVCIVTVLLRYVVVSQLATVAINLAIFGTLGAQFGVNPFIIVFVTHQIGGNWNTSYNNPVAQGFRAIVGDDNITYKDSKIVSYVYCLACLIAFTLSVPIWKGIGML